MPPVASVGENWKQPGDDANCPVKWLPPRALLETKTAA